jgi:hypothetical protein
MKARCVLVSICTVVCLATIAGVVVQGRQVGDLRSERRQLLEELEKPATASKPVDHSLFTVQPAQNSPSAELLQLRDQVSRLTRRKQEFSAVKNENNRMREQLAARATNAIKLPPNYVRRINARMAGYNTPEATAETFLWAINNRDFVNLLRTMTPESAEGLEEAVARGSRNVEDVFGNAMLPGFLISGRTNYDEHRIGLKVEVLPGGPTDEMRFRQINGQWKLEGF